MFPINILQHTGFPMLQTEEITKDGRDFTLRHIEQIPVGAIIRRDNKTKNNFYVVIESNSRPAINQSVYKGKENLLITLKTKQI